MMSGPLQVDNQNESGFKAVRSARDDSLAPRPVSIPDGKSDNLCSAQPGFRGLRPGPSGYLVVTAGVPEGHGVTPE